MPDGTTSILSMTWDAVKWLWFALAGLLIYNGKKMGKDVDDIKKDYVHSGTFNDTLKSLRGDIKESGNRTEGQIQQLRNDLREDVKGVHERIDKIKE